MKRLNPESALTRQIQDALSRIGAWCVKYHSGGGVRFHTRSGIPDLLICYKGRFFAAEVKTDTGKVSEAQRKVIAEIRAAGGAAGVVRSVQDALDLLSGIKVYNE